VQDSGNPDGRRKRRRPEPSAAQRALGLLVRREHSKKELERKLVARGVDQQEASSAVARMAAEGWQDDVRFAASLARARAASGYGPIRIRVELETHGLDEQVVCRGLAALAEDGRDNWTAQARDLVQRRYGSDIPRDLALRRKAADFLLRRGFDGDTIRAATRVSPGEDD
jgi:regulatory protein